MKINKSYILTKIQFANLNLYKMQVKILTKFGVMLKKIRNRKLLLFKFILYTFLSFGCKSVNGGNDLSYYNLSGDVMSCLQRIYEAVETDGKIHKGSLKSHDYQLTSFNRDGYRTEEYNYNQTGAVYSKYIWNYDIHGSLATSSIIFFEDEAGSDIYYNYLYDDKLRLIEKIETNEGGSDYETIKYIYDINGNNILMQFYENDKIGDHKRKFDYDKDKNLIEEIWINMYDIGEVQFKTIYDYDKAGNMIEMKFYMTDGILHKKELYFYDDDIFVRQEFFVKDNNDNFKLNFDGALDITYDKFGNEIEKIYYDINNVVENVTSYKYKYDNMNNWIERIEFEDESVINVATRDIEYY